MLRLLEEHAPHIGPVIVVFAAILWLWLRDLRTRPQDDELERRREWNMEEQEHRLQTRPTRRVARHSIVLLASVGSLLVTSLALYVTETLGGPRLLLVVWAHVVLGLGVCVATLAKLRAVGRRKIRRTMRFESLLRVTSSATLVALLAPLLVTGVILIFVPSASGFAARLHLLVATWFAVLVIYHTVTLLRGVAARLKLGRSRLPTSRVVQPALALAPTSRGDEAFLPPAASAAAGRAEARTPTPSITREGRT